MKLWVDPPGGWRYGFPQIWDGSKDLDVDNWMRQAGYPDEVRETYGKHFYMRMWEVVEDDNNVDE
jgi:hypothetical protein